MRTGIVVAILAALASFIVGFLARPVADWGRGQLSGGADVQCVASGTLCVGAPSSAVFDYRMDDHLGGVLDISCGFVRPGNGSGQKLNPVELMAADCAESRYMIAFSNGRRLTNVWVDRDRIVRLDDYPRHSIDP
ncbi:MAG: hypothetical protein ACXW3O_01565 [Brevundimonas sp.]